MVPSRVIIITLACCRIGLPFGNLGTLAGELGYLATAEPCGLRQEWCCLFDESPAADWTILVELVNDCTVFTLPHLVDNKIVCWKV